MKLLSVLILLITFQSTAAVRAQNVTLTVKDAPLKEVLFLINQQTNYEFIYDAQTMQSAKPVTLKVANVSIQAVLKACLFEQNLDYVLKENTIVITSKQQKMVTKLAPITGKVVDDTNLPLIGVFVKIKGTTGGVVTNTKGEFSINAVKGNTLVFSYLGFKTVELVVGSQTIVNVKLETSATALSEMVVTGYGTQKRSDVISSIGEVNVKDMQKAPVASFEEALQGRVAGVQVSSSEGGPLGTNNIVIRGNNSITQGNSPLWVVDGFPLEDPNNNTLNPNDIESITVLKDAASTAIYGSRGANGVILVTTKKGKAGAPTVSFNSTYGYQENLKKVKLLNAYEFVKLQTELVGLDAITRYAPGDPALRDDYTPGGRTLDYYKTAQTLDFQNLLFRSAPFQDYSLTLSGGNGKSTYLISGSITDRDGTLKNTNFNRYQGRVAFKQEITSKLNFNLNANYAKTNTVGSSPSDFPGSASYSLLNNIWGYRPTPSVSSTIEQQLNNAIDPDGQLGYAVNPIIENAETINNSGLDNLVANASFDYNVAKYLTLRVSAGLNSVKRTNNTFFNSLTSRGNFTSVFGPNGSIMNNSVINVLNENTLNYQRTINKYHNIDFLGGFSAQSLKNNNNGLFAIQVPNDELGVSGLDEGTPTSVISGSSQNFLNSYFGRFNYNFKSRYYVSGVVRADGSSKFAPGHKWGYFPSGAIAWNIANEAFMKKITFLNTLKLRGSYGMSGNNRVSDFAYLSPINLSAVNYAFNSVYMKGAIQPVLANQNLKWETTATTDVGLDAGFFNNRIEVVVDYYRKVTSDLLLQATVPSHLGYTSGIQNIGSVGNSGWEFSLNTINLDSKKITWNSNLNISFNTNKVLALSSGQTGLISQVGNDNGFPYIAQVGGPIAQFIGYKWLGNYQYEDFDLRPNGAYVLKANIPANGTSRSSIKPGDIKYQDINGDGTMTDADKIIIGSPNPLFTGGFSNDFKYKSFDVNILLTFSYGNEVLNINRLGFEGIQAGYVNQFATFADRWTPTNPTNLYPRAGGTIASNVSSRVVEDASFLRLKTVSLGYNVPQTTLKRIKVKNARVFCSAQDIAVLTNYQGSDPEVSTRPGALTQGFDQFAYPRSFTLTFGLNLSF